MARIPDVAVKEWDWLEPPQTDRLRPEVFAEVVVLAGGRSQQQSKSESYEWEDESPGRRTSPRGRSPSGEHPGEVVALEDADPAGLPARLLARLEPGDGAVIEHPRRRAKRQTWPSVMRAITAVVGARTRSFRVGPLGNAVRRQVGQP